MTNVLFVQEKKGLMALYLLLKQPNTYLTETKKEYFILILNKPPPKY
jgi:hypothetical protein